jgi:deoxycytidine triphosphate deaminase
MLDENTIDSRIIAKTEETVIKDFKKTSLYDPLPHIPPALLNHTDIKRYILTSGIIYPFIPKNLTGATYKVPLLGDIYYWEADENNQFQKRHVHFNNESIIKKEKITLKKNSISYFHISTTFRVPYYLVYRFNLTVSLAQKGLLLGTGPIVDPGFEGRIMIPIHNLTSKDYELEAGSGLIRIEFTKLSPNEAYDIKNEISLETYNYKFPEEAKYWDENKYFKDINNNNPIISSIPGSIQLVEEKAIKAEEKAIKAEEKASSAEKSATSIRNITLGSAIIGIVAIGASILMPLYSLIKDTNTASLKLVEDNENLKLRIKNLEKDLEKIKDERITKNEKTKN